MPIRVLVCDDHPIMREGVRALLARAGGIDVVGEAANGYQAIDQAVELRPDVALIDITMPALDGLEATRRIHRRVPAVKVLILTMHDDPRYVLLALEAGASGLVLKQHPAGDLVDAIRTLSRREGFLGPPAARSLVADYLADRASGRVGPVVEKLTRREEHVLRLLCDGYTNREIAAGLGLSLKTVETHRCHILAKLGLRRRAELLHYARTHGLLARATEQ